MLFWVSGNGLNQRTKCISSVYFFSLSYNERVLWLSFHVFVSSEEPLTLERWREFEQILCIKITLKLFKIKRKLDIKNTSYFSFGSFGSKYGRKVSSNTV